MPANPNLTRQPKKKKKKPFSLFLSPLPISLTFSQTLKAWSNVEGATIFIFFISPPLLQNPLKELQILQRNPNKGVVHAPKPNDQWNSQKNTVRNPCHKLKSTKKKKKKKRINPIVSTSNFTSILQYPSHKEQHRQQYY